MSNSYQSNSEALRASVLECLRENNYSSTLENIGILPTPKGLNVVAVAIHTNGDICKFEMLLSDSSLVDSEHKVSLDMSAYKKRV